MKALVFLGGDFPSEQLIRRSMDGASKIYCADSGFDALIPLGIRPDMVIGDMDSLSEEGKILLEREKINYRKLNPEKDETDTYTVLRQALRDGVTEMVLFGAVGNRQDHQLATFYLLEFLNQKGCRGMILDDGNSILYGEEESIILPREYYDYLSIIPISEEVTVSTEGCYYEIKNTTLYRNYPRGVSNRWVRDPAVITIEKGKSFLIRSKDR